MDTKSALRLPARAISPGRALSVRVAIAFGLLAFIVFVVFLDRGGYRDSADDRMSLLDCLYYATVTMTTTGYGDVVPVSDSARLMNAIVVTPLRIMFLILLVGTTLEVLANQGRERYRESRWRKHMRNHVVIIGYGTKGRSAVQTLKVHGITPEKIIVIDPNPIAIAEAQADGLAGIVGDATRREVLARAEAALARQIIITADRDDAAVLATLTVRQLNSKAYVVVAVREEQNVSLVRQSGADATVTSSEAVGRMLGLSTISPSLGQILEDLLTSGDGMEVAERDVIEDEVGRSPKWVNDQVVGVKRGETVFRFFDQEVSTLETGDKLIVVRAAEQ